MTDFGTLFTRLTEPDPRIDLEAVLEVHQPDWSDWGLDHPDEGAVCSCGYNGAYEECPTVQAITEAMGYVVH